MSQRLVRTVRSCVPLFLAGLSACSGPRANAQATAELAGIIAEDQADRNSVTPAQFAALPPATQDSLDKWMTARDSARRERVKVLMQAGAAKVAQDWYNAAVVMQHSHTEDGLALAHDWAERAVALDSTDEQFRYLYAASRDRLEASRGLPQWFGTRIEPGPGGLPVLAPVDTTKVTDAVRQYYAGWTLAERRAAVADMNVRPRAGAPAPRP